jgi:hypothetical protein
LLSFPPSPTACSSRTTGADERKPSDRCFRFDANGNAEWASFADLTGSNPAPRWFGHQFHASQFEFA